MIMVIIGTKCSKVVLTIKLNMVFNHKRKEKSRKKIKAALLQKTETTPQKMMDDGARRNYCHPRRCFEASPKRIGGKIVSWTRTPPNRCPNRCPSRCLS